MSEFSYRTSFDTPELLVVRGLRDPLPKDDLLAPYGIIHFDRPLVECGRVIHFIDESRTIRCRIDEPASIAGTYQFQQDAILALYLAKFPNRKVLQIEECEHDGDLSRAVRKLAGADVAIIDSGIDMSAYEMGWVEVDDPRSEEALMRVLYAAHDPLDEDTPFTIFR